MLLRFRFSNFRSFREEQELSLVASAALKESDSLVVTPRNLGQAVLPLACIYGANASGKTNVIRALAFFALSINRSHADWKPDDNISVEPFAGQSKSREAGSLFEADFLLDGVRHTYGFRVTSKAFVEEWLIVYPKGKKQSWFHRRLGKPIAFGAKLPGPNRVIESLTRKNSLFLSAAAQNNHQALMPVYKWIGSHLNFVATFLGESTTYLQHTARLCEEPQLREAVERLVSSADLGIDGLNIEKEAMSAGVRAILLTIEPPLDQKMLEQMLPKRVRLTHKIGDQTLIFSEDQESTGTLAYLRLLGPIARALKEGMVVCVDELDSSLHPLLAKQLVRLFADKTVNVSGAQLIFNTHDATLLSTADLRRDEIWFAEKDSSGGSHLYPLTDYKPRVKENLETGYLQGRYGAVPFLASPNLLNALGRGRGKES